MTGWVRNRSDEKVGYISYMPTPIYASGIYSIMVACYHDGRPLIAHESLLENHADRLQVEGEAQGDETSVSQLMKDLKKGPTHALVSKLDVEDRELVDGESEFEVRRG